MNEGSNATVSEAKSSAEPPRRMKRNTTVMSSSSSRSDDGKATEKGRVPLFEKGIFFFQ